MNLPHVSYYTLQIPKNIENTTYNNNHKNPHKTDKIQICSFSQSYVYQITKQKLPSGANKKNILLKVKFKAQAGFCSLSIFTNIFRLFF